MQQSDAVDASDEVYIMQALSGGWKSITNYGLRITEIQ
jgi:hypothetical protein